MKHKEIHLEILKIAVNDLKPLLDEIVFLGGSVIATKLEAFKGRGKGQFMTSHDIEDIVTLIDGCSYFAKSISDANADVKEYIKHELAQLLENASFVESLDAHISDRVNVDARKKIVIEKIESVVG